MDRRTFLLNSTATAAIATLGNTAQAAIEDALPAVNLLFTKEHAGRWQSKKGTHVPNIKVTGNLVKISTDHGQSKKHFIVRHTLLLEDGTVVGAKTFTANDAPISEHELPADYKGRIFATSFCNQHDLWLAETTL